MQYRRIAVAWITGSVILGGGLLGGCGGEEGGDDDTLLFEPTLSAIQEEVFDLSCTFSSCHSSGPGGRRGDLILERDASFENLVDIDADHTAARALSLKRVVVMDPDASFLVLKLTAPLDSQFGDLMPQGSQSGLMPAGKIDVIAEWIRRGAAND